MQGSFGERMGEVCRADESPMLTARTLRNTSIIATHLRAPSPSSEKTDALSNEHAFVAAVTFQPGSSRDQWLDGRLVPPQPPQPSGSVLLMDLRRENRARFKSPLNSVQLYFPLKTLHAVADANELSRVDVITTASNTMFQDAEFAQIAASLLPAFAHADEVSCTFLDHLLMASALHLMVKHAGAVAARRRHRGGLAPWQQRRVLELLDANLNGNLGLTALAQSCDLSTRHFARAFADTNGMPPHRWMLQRRVEKAKDLLIASNLSLDEIASQTSFASQSHFNRVFKQHVGRSPGAWRRLHRT